MSDQRQFTPRPAVGPLTREAEVAVKAWGIKTAVQEQARRLCTPAAIVALCVLSLAFFWKIILLRQVLVPIDILYQMDPLWRSLAPHTFTEAANPLDFDDLTQFYPWADLARQALHRGTMPLWNPYVFTGTPFLAAMQPAVLYPINVLLAWLAPAADVPGLRALADMAVALVGMFLFARSLKLSRAGAIMAALAFGLSLPYVVWLEHPIGAAFTWLPWMLLCIEWAMATRGSLWWLASTAAVVALELLAGHGESTVHVLLLCMAYTLFRALLAYRHLGGLVSIMRPVLVLIAGAVLGMGMAAAQIVPTLAQLPGSEEAAHRNLLAQAQPLAPLGAPVHWITLLLALVPNFFGNPTWHESLMPLFELNYHETALYIGTVPLLLAALALVRHRTAYVVFFAIVALVALGMALHLPVVNLANSLPVLRVVSNGRMRIEYAFSMAMLAGYGLDTLRYEGKSRAAWSLTRVWLLAVTALSADAVWMLHAFPNGLAPLQAYPLLRQMALRLAHLQIAANDRRLHAPAGAHALSLWSALPAAAPIAWLAIFWGALWLHRRGAITAPGLRWVALAVAAVDLLLTGSGYHTTVSQAQVLALPPAVRVLQSDHTLYRIAGLGDALLPSTSILYGLQDVRGYDPTYSAAYERYFAASFSSSGATLTLPARMPDPGAARMLSLMNVKYIVAACNVRVNRRVYPVVYRGAGCIYRNRFVMPRALMVHRIRWAAPARATDLLSRGSIDPTSTALLDPSTARGGAWPVGPATALARPDKVWITSYGLNSVDLMVQSAMGGVVVLSDAYAPGWSARVGGRPAPIARADAVFRAVAVGPGTHHVSFTYQPIVFTMGVVISGIAGGLWLVILLVCLWRSLTSGPPASCRRVPTPHRHCVACLTHSARDDSV